MSITAHWEVHPNQFRHRVRRQIANHAYRLGKQIFDGVVARTPVDSGRARACWTLSLNEPEYKKIDWKNVRPGKVLKPPKRKALRPLPDFPVIYVSNGQPYIELLEYGWSAQAPAGMLRVTMANLKFGSTMTGLDK